MLFRSPSATPQQVLFVRGAPVTTHAPQSLSLNYRSLSLSLSLLSSPPWACTLTELCASVTQEKDEARIVATRSLARPKEGRRSRRGRRRRQQTNEQTSACRALSYEAQPFEHGLGHAQESRSPPTRALENSQHAHGVRSSAIKVRARMRTMSAAAGAQQAQRRPRSAPHSRLLPREPTKGGELAQTHSLAPLGQSEQQPASQPAIQP